MTGGGFANSHHQSPELRSGATLPSLKSKGASSPLPVIVSFAEGPMLPNNPEKWPEPWRSVYMERRDERIAIMIAEGQSEHAAVVKQEVLRIEHELRRAHEKRIER